MSTVPYISEDEIESKAKNLLKDYQIDKIPIDVELLAHKLGIDIHYNDLGDSVSGILIFDSNRPTIGINQTNPEVRQRFTMAHEIGHYILHKEYNNLFIDKVAFRASDVTTQDEKYMEIQANKFAAALLMPDEILQKEFEYKDPYMVNDNAILVLAEKYAVSLQSMTFRISNILKPIDSTIDKVTRTLTSD